MKMKTWTTFTKIGSLLGSDWATFGQSNLATLIPNTVDVYSK